MKLAEPPIQTVALTPEAAFAPCMLETPTTDASWKRVASDVAALTKARLSLMVLFTVAIGYVLGSGGNVDPAVLMHALLGTSLVAFGASILNQWMERGADVLMHRTRNRPIPAGRVRPETALRWGIVTSMVGLAWLALGANPLAAFLAFVTLVSYVFCYTPLKQRTGLNTFVGAIPGALPPIIGWAAATGAVAPEAWSLFLIIFLWQFPHFWAIAWLYREDYARAGMKMVPIQDVEGGRMTGRLMMQNCLVLIPASWGPVVFHLAGPRYAVAALLLGIMFLAFAVRFWLQPSNQRARQVLWASLVYLPVVLLLLVLDGPLVVFAE